MIAFFGFLFSKSHRVSNFFFYSLSIILANFIKQSLIWLKWNVQLVLICIRERESLNSWSKLEYRGYTWLWIQKRIKYNWPHVFRLRKIMSRNKQARLSSVLGFVDCSLCKPKSRLAIIRTPYPTKRQQRSGSQWKIIVE